MARSDYKEFFTDLRNTTPYFKVAVEGAAGSGKTFTLALVAAGLHKHIGSKKPIVLFDTEQSAKFLGPFFKGRGIKVQLKPSRSLTDLIDTMDYCDAGNADILFIDSITHVWEGFLAAYEKQKGRKYGLQFQDWGFIKPTWKREYSDRLVMGRCHTMFTGREGFTYAHETNEDTGKKELIKTGVKMKVEGDTAYEPDLLFRMERFEELTGREKRVWREATIIKDRANLIDGKTFVNPDFDSFLPVIDFLLADVYDPVESNAQTDADLIGHEDKRKDNRSQRKILLERNDALLAEVAGGTTKEAIATKLSLMKYGYHGETSMTAVAEMSEAELQEANGRLGVLVPIVKKIKGGEMHVYGNVKAVTAARAKYLGEDYTEDIVAAGKELLIQYQEHIVATYKQQQGVGDEG